MITRFESSQVNSLLKEQLKGFLMRDIARNYFLLLALDSEKNYFSTIFLEYSDETTLVGAGFLRTSGTFQLYLPNFEACTLSDWRMLFKSPSVKKCVVDHETFEILQLSEYYCGVVKAYIACCTPETRTWSKLDIDTFLDSMSLQLKTLTPVDAEAISKLYEKVFHTFPKLEQLRTRYATRGAGWVLANANEWISTVSTEYVTNQDALVVGVATDPEFGSRGLATALLKWCGDYYAEQGIRLWLQYDNPIAGRIYERLGYKKVYEMIHAENQMNESSRMDCK